MLLDEPTNHMDIVGKETLENLLKAYTGTLIVVSHDRYFINKIADSLLIFENDEVKFFDGTYQEYMQIRKDNEKDDEKNVTIKEKKTNNQYLENKERNRVQGKIKRLEKEIEEREAKVERLHEEMSSEEICTSYVKLAELQSQVDELEKEIEEKMDLWQELSSSLE